MKQENQQVIRVDLGIGAEMKIRATTTMRDYVTASQQTARNVLKGEEVDEEVKRVSATELLSSLTR